MPASFQGKNVRHEIFVNPKDTASLASTVGSVFLPLVWEFAGSIPGSGTFFQLLSVTGERMSNEYWLNARVKPAQEKRD